MRLKSTCLIALALIVCTMMAQAREYSPKFYCGVVGTSVEDAKRLLMTQYQIDEPEAHRRMQQYAMRHGIKMTEYAAILLQNSEGTEV